LLLGSLGGLLSGLLRGETARADAPLVLAVVVSRSSTLTDIAMGTLRRVFLGELVDDPSGTRLIGFNHPPRTRPRTVFDLAVLGMNPEESARHWVDELVRGGARPPRNVPSVDLLRQVIAALPGAIGYLPLADLDGTLRVVTVGGLGPDSLKYPIR
jgi:hypothetical protein